MVILPAIDILGGKAVRLLKGDYGQVSVYGDRPWEIASGFAACGCSAVHIVDLDGAREGSAVNLDIVKRIAHIDGLYSEIGGGIRNINAVEDYLEAGISRVILGTAALEDPKLLETCLRQFGPSRVAVGVDLKDGKVAVKGWLEKSDMGGFEFLSRLQDLGVEGVIVTDISRDGAMNGTNLGLYREISSRFSLEVTASGGISTLDDLRELKSMGIHGAIIGKAYYSGAIDLKDALEVAG